MGCKPIMDATPATTLSVITICICSLREIHKNFLLVHFLFTARCTLVQSTVLRLHVVCPSVCLSVTLVDHDHIGWKSWKLIAWTISQTPLLFISQRSSTYSQGNTEKFWGDNVRSTPTSITSGWIESTESHVILGGGVAGCLLFVYFCWRIAR